MQSSDDISSLHHLYPMFQGNDCWRENGDKNRQVKITQRYFVKILVFFVKENKILDDLLKFSQPLYMQI